MFDVPKTWLQFKDLGTLTSNLRFSCVMLSPPCRPELLAVGLRTMAKQLNACIPGAMDRIPKIQWPLTVRGKMFIHTEIAT